MHCHKYMKTIRPNILVIFKKGDKVLVQKGIDEKIGEVFYRCLGGGIEFGETSIQAVVREMKEELGIVTTNEKLLGVVENIFTYNGEQGHEITFLYMADSMEKDIYNQKIIQVIDKVDKYAEWISVDQVKNGNTLLYPKETINYI